MTPKRRPGLEGGETAHLRGVDDSAETLFAVLRRDLSFGVADKYARKAAPPGKTYPGAPAAAE